MEEVRKGMPRKIKEWKRVKTKKEKRVRDE